MTTPIVRAKRGDTTFVPLVQFVNHAAGERADITGRTITAAALMGPRSMPVAVEVVDAEQGEVILEMTPPAVGPWSVNVAGLDAEFILQVEEDVTNG